MSLYKNIVLIFILCVSILLVMRYTEEVPFWALDSEVSFSYRHDNVQGCKVFFQQPDIIKSCPKERCVRKCCPKNSSVIIDDHRNVRCSEFNNSTLLYDPESSKSPSLNDTDFNSNIEVIYGFPCYTQYAFVSVMSGIWTETLYDTITNERVKYCFDVTTNKSNTYRLYFGCSIDLGIYFRGFLKLAPVPLFVTFIVHSLIPELRNSTYGLCLMSHTASLFFAYLISVIKISLLHTDLENVVFLIQHYHKLLKSLCYGYFIFYYAAFFWLNIICFDIWKTLRSINPCSAQKKLDVKKFLIYSAYAWCMSVLCSVCYLFVDDLLEIDIFPEFDECLIYGHRLNFCSYFYGPLCINLLVNVFLFGHTLHYVKTTWKLTDAVTETKQRKVITAKDRERISVCGKLFVVMGIPYIIEMICYIYAEKLRDIGLWSIADIVRTLQGIFLMFLFVVKKRILILLYKKFYPYCQCLKLPMIDFDDSSEPDDNLSGSSNEMQERK